MENFAVKSEGFALYEAFKKDCEAIGWKYNSSFNSFSRGNTVRCNCLYFSNEWEEFDGLSFAFSNSDRRKSFSLETQYGEALAFAKKVYEQENKIKFGFTGTCDLSANGTLDISAMWIPNNSSSYAYPLVDGFFTVTNSALSITKFKVGDWVRDITNGRTYKVLSNDVLSGNMSCEVTKQGYIFQDLLEKWLPKKGEYYFLKSKLGNTFIGISDGGREITSKLASFMVNKNETYFRYGIDVADIDIILIRPATPSEIALLDTKLAEQGKRFDKEKCELVDIYKPKFAKGDIVKDVDEGRIGVIVAAARTEREYNLIGLSDTANIIYRDSKLTKIGNSL